jgi:hypothetical protein
VSDSSFRLGDRVWAQGREATMTEWSYKKNIKKLSFSGWCNRIKTYG